MKSGLVWMLLLFAANRAFSQNTAADTAGHFAERRWFWKGQIGLSGLMPQVRISAPTLAQGQLPETYRISRLSVGEYLGIGLNRRLSKTAGLEMRLGLEVCRYHMRRTSYYSVLGQYDSVRQQATLTRKAYSEEFRALHPHLWVTVGAWGRIPGLNPKWRMALSVGAFVAPDFSRNTRFDDLGPPPFATYRRLRMYLPGVGLLVQPSVQYRWHETFWLEGGYRHYAYPSVLYGANGDSYRYYNGDVRYRSVYVGVLF